MGERRGAQGQEREKEGRKVTLEERRRPSYIFLLSFCCIRGRILAAHTEALRFLVGTR